MHSHKAATEIISLNVHSEDTVYLIHPKPVQARPTHCLQFPDKIQEVFDHKKGRYQGSLRKECLSALFEVGCVLLEESEDL